MSVLRKSISESTMIAELNREIETNPMSFEMAEAIIAACKEADASDNVKTLILTGGQGRSFCAGGDFNEAIGLNSPEAVEDWIDRWISLYVAVLNVRKPTIAAMNGYAIGLGFQLALMCDWRIATKQTKLIMWELKHGIACTLGTYILEKIATRLAALHLVYGCDTVSVEWAMQERLFNEVVDAGDLMTAAVRRAEQFASYPSVPFQRTKAYANHSFIAGLREAASASKEAHAASFAANSAMKHFSKVLHRTAAE
jgi:carboxymethylproline synthase